MPAPRNYLKMFIDSSGTMSAYEPSWREQLARRFVPDDAPVPHDREMLLKKLLGSSGTGADRSGGDLDYVPGVGQAMLGLDSMEALAHGNYRRAAGAGAEMAIPMGAGRMIAGGARVASNGVRNTLRSIDLAKWADRGDKAAAAGVAVGAGGGTAYGMWLIEQLLKDRSTANRNRDRMR